MQQNNDNKIFIIYSGRVSKMCWLVINSILYVTIPYLEKSFLRNINE